MSIRISRVLILSDNPFVTEALRLRMTARFPDALLQHVSVVVEAAKLLATAAVDIFVLQLELFESDGLDLLRHSRACRVRTLVITGCAAPRVALSMRTLGIEAVHDFRRGACEELNGALDAVAAGRRHWSASFDECLVGEEVRRIRHQLAPREQLIFALFATGLGEKDLADRLALRLSSARSLVRDLRAKFGVHDRHDVQQAGARLGYTRLGSDGLRPFGMSILIEEYRTQSRRPASLPAALLAACGLPADVDPRKTPHSAPLKLPER